MESALKAESLGQHIDRCLDDARTDWLKEHAAGRDVESCWTQEVVETSCSLQLKHGGRAAVQVTIISRHSFKCETTVFQLRQKGPRDWLRIRDSLGLYRK